MSNVLFKYWIQAARPKTLLVSIAPVMMSLAIASIYIKINWLPAIICLVFALMAQILSNFVNDYADGIKGADNERLGPQRMVASGLIAPKQMRSGIIIWSILTFVLGCTLLYWGGLVLLPFGMVILLCALAYSTGPFPLSRHALGDVAVILFYGITPVALTFFIQTGFVGWEIIIAGIAVGLVADNLLIVNNYRDVEEDVKYGKKTTVSLLGRPFMKTIFICNPLIAILLGFVFLRNIINPLTWLVAIIPFLAYSIFVSMKFVKAEGMEFNRLIGMSSLEAVLYAITIVIAIIYI